MYLKRVELQGFKSFADKSFIEFMPGVIGIVGPNGCGKSNITDAIRWVLGEKSAKAMRGDTMTDVIFSGSEDRKPLNIAEVTLVFDNEDHYLDYDSHEVEITRRIYRDGSEAQYFINRQSVRLKDITTLIMDTGLGRDSLSIISQNSINEFVASKPEDRRGMFEEAAGVAKYKARKKESVSKLARTTENLERVEDITGELERQLNPLKRQKEKAEKYLQLSGELQEIEVTVLVKEIEKLNEKLRILNQELTESYAHATELEGNIILNENKNTAIQEKMYALDSEINELQGKLLATMNRVNELETQKVEIDANRKHILENQNEDNLALRIASMKETLQDALSEYNDRVQRYQQVKKEKEELENKQKEALLKENLLREEAETLNLKIHAERNESLRLKELLDSKSNYPYGVRSVLQAKETLSGIKGTIGDLISARENYETALHISLGAASNHIVTRNQEDAKRAIAYLKRNQAGRATFLPLDVIKGRTIRGDLALIARESQGYLGVMSDFVEYDHSLDQIVSNLLGSIIVADHIDHAVKIARNTSYRLKVVTLSGDIVNVGGSLTGGNHKNKNDGFASKKELERLNEKLTDHEKELHHKKFELSKQENMTRELRQMFMQKQMSFAQLEIVVTNKRNDLQLAKSDYEALTNKSVELEEIADGSKSNELLEILNKAKKERDQLKEQIQGKRELRMSYVNENDEIAKTLREERSHLKIIEEAITNNKINKTKYETEIQNALNRLNDSYQLTYEHALEFVNEGLDTEDAKEKVRDLRIKIAGLGHINLDAIDQYTEISQRYESLNKNRIELIEAKDSLLKAINDMDHIMIDRFTKTFEAVNVEFNRVFRYLFGGGHASLHYVDPQDILETGIEIEAQPPGKSAKLHSFSGGENALIALSCLFAIMSVRPVPLCILDEVEAALDPANVERFAKYLKEYSDKTQFIVVTHREGTMAECDLLYGATMQQKGVTKLVSVKLDDATALADA